MRPAWAMPPELRSFTRAGRSNADGDGAAGGGRVDSFFRLFGDGDVDRGDRKQFNQRFGKSLGT